MRRLGGIERARHLSHPHFYHLLSRLKPNARGNREFPRGGNRLCSIILDALTERNTDKDPHENEVNNCKLSSEAVSISVFSIVVF